MSCENHKLNKSLILTHIDCARQSTRPAFNLPHKADKSRAFFYKSHLEALPFEKVGQALPFEKVGLEFEPKAHSLVIHNGINVDFSFSQERQLIANHLRLLGKSKQAFLIENCGNILKLCGKWLFNFKKGEKEFFPNLCGYPRICPECALRYKNKQIRKYQKWLMTFPLTEYKTTKGLRLITLTMKSVSNFADGISTIKHNFRKFRQREVIKKILYKGLVCIEKTFNNKTNRWNVHIHIVANSDYINQKVLSQEWSKATKEKGIITDIRLCGSYKGSIGYLLKYTTKGSYETPRQKAESFIALYRQKLIYPFGLNYHDKEIIKKEKKQIYEYLSPKSFLFDLIPTKTNKSKPFNFILLIDDLCKKLYGDPLNFYNEMRDV